MEKREQEVEKKAAEFDTKEKELQKKQIELQTREKEVSSLPSLPSLPCPLLFASLSSLALPPHLFLRLPPSLPPLLTLPTDDTKGGGGWEGEGGDRTRSADPYERQGEGFAREVSKRGREGEGEGEGERGREGV